MIIDTNWQVSSVRLTVKLITNRLVVTLGSRFKINLHLGRNK